MIQHQFEQFENALVKISNIISFLKGITQLCFPFINDTSTRNLSTDAIELSEKELARETFGSSNLGLIFKSK